MAVLHREREHRQRHNFMPAASYESPVAMAAMSIYLVRNLANSPSIPEMLEEAPFRDARGSPTVPTFYGDTRYLRRRVP